MAERSGRAARARQYGVGKPPQTRENCKPEPRLGGAFEVAASRSRHLATLNGCKQVAYTVILKDEWTQAEAFAPPPGSGSCAFAFVHEESKFVTLRSEGDQHPQQGRDERKEETVSQPGIPKEVTVQKAAAQATVAVVLLAAAEEERRSTSTAP